MEDPISQSKESFAHECHIRDLYAARLEEFRPDERVVKTEQIFPGSRVRADIWTVDRHEVLRVWEFKIFASYDGLGQALTYLALARMHQDFRRPVRAVLAAFTFQPEVAAAVEVLNLGVELVTVPTKLRFAGGVPLLTSPAAPSIPLLTELLHKESGPSA